MNALQMNVLPRLFEAILHDPESIQTADKYKVTAILEERKVEIIRHADFQDHDIKVFVDSQLAWGYEYKRLTEKEIKTISSFYNSIGQSLYDANRIREKQAKEWLIIRFGNGNG